MKTILILAMLTAGLFGADCIDPFDNNGTCGGVTWIK